MKEKQKKSPTGNFPLGVFSCSVPPPPPAVGWLVIIGSYQFPPSVILFLFEHKRGKRESYSRHHSYVCKLELLFVVMAEGYMLRAAKENCAFHFCFCYFLSFSRFVIGLMDYYSVLLFLPSSNKNWAEWTLKLMEGKYIYFFCRYPIIPVREF
jgi:hypothetical protein